MANEYVTLATLKTAVKLEPSDTTSDALLNQALAAASRGIDRKCGRRFFLDAAPVQRVFNPRRRVACESDGEVLLINDIGDTAGLAVETGSGSTWTAVTGFETTPDNALLDGRPITGLLRPNGIWRWHASSTTRVRITARWGWPTIPDEVVQATLIQASRLYKRKDSSEGVLGSAEWGVVRLSRVDPDVAALVGDLTLPGFG